MNKENLLSKNKRFLKSIRSAIPKHCSNCGYKYQDKDLTIIQKDNYNAVLHLTCSQCNESYLINILSPLGTLQGSSRMPLKIDIRTADEAKRFIGSRPVSSDDVINIHKLLKNIKSAEDLDKKLCKREKRL
jgi:hypothetical protein